MFVVPLPLLSYETLSVPVAKSLWVSVFPSVKQAHVLQGSSQQWNTLKHVHTIANLQTVL